MIRTLKFFFTLTSFLMICFCIPAKAEVSLLDDNIFIQEIRNQNIKAVKTSLLKGTSPNIKSASGQSALLVAASIGNAELIQLLLENRASLNAKDKDGNTALSLAAAHKNTNALFTLLSFKPKINLANKDGMTPLMIASEKGFLANVKLLIENGAASDRTDYAGKTAAILASENNHTAIAQYLNTLSKTPDIAE